MTKIYKSAKDMYAGPTLIYPKGNIAYKDVVCDTPFTTKELREAFLRDGLVDIAAGTYGNNQKALIVPLGYKEGTDGVGQIAFPVPKIEGEKNQYPIYVDEDAENCGVHGSTMEVNHETHSIKIIKNEGFNQSTYIYFGKNSRLRKTIEKLKDRTLTISCRIDFVRDEVPPRPKCKPQFEFSIGAYSKSVIPSDNYNYTNIAVTGYDFFSGSAAGWGFSIDSRQTDGIDLYRSVREYTISNMQIEYGTYQYSDYEPYAPKLVFEPYISMAIDN